MGPLENGSVITPSDLQKGFSLISKECVLSFLTASFTSCLGLGTLNLLLNFALLVKLMEQNTKYSDTDLITLFSNRLHGLAAVAMVVIEKKQII